MKRALMRAAVARPSRIALATLGLVLTFSAQAGASSASQDALLRRLESPEQCQQEVAATLAPEARQAGEQQREDLLALRAEAEKLSREAQNAQTLEEMQRIQEKAAELSARIMRTQKGSLDVETWYRAELADECGAPSAPSTNPSTSVGGPSATGPAGAAGFASSTGESIADPAARAYRVLQGEEAGSGTLREAIQAAGFGIRSPDGTIVVDPAEPSQGLAFGTWEVAGMAELASQSFGYPLTELARDLEDILGLPRGGPIARLLLEDIRAQAESPHATVRFGAAFLAELGQQGPYGYDLLDADVAPEDVVLDGVQLAFVLRRLGGDLLALGGAPVAVTDLDHGYRRTLIIPAAFRGSSSTAQALPITWYPGAPCAFDDTEGLILDWSAFTATTGFGKVLEYVADNSDIASATRTAGIAAGVSAANALLGYLKVALSYALVEADFEMDGSGPLVRTRSTGTPGERRAITVSLSMDIDDMQWFNCTRIALNAVGLDFNVTNGGPLSDVEVSWRLTEGGVRGGSQGEADLGFVQFAHNPQNHATDASGRASIDVEGKPQKQSVPESAAEVMREAEVQIEVKLKPNDLYRELESPDLISSAMGGLVGAIPEIIYRTRVPVASHRFQVKDWVRGYWFYTKWTQTGMVEGNDVRIDGELAGRVCGDPEKDDWKLLSKHAVITSIGNKVHEDSYEGPLPGLESGIFPEGITLRVDPTDPPSLHFTSRIPDATPPVVDVVVPLQEIGEDDDFCQSG